MENARLGTAAPLFRAISLVLEGVVGQRRCRSHGILPLFVDVSAAGRSPHRRAAAVPHNRIVPPAALREEPASRVFTPRRTAPGGGHGGAAGDPHGRAGAARSPALEPLPL